MKDRGTSVCFIQNVQDVTLLMRVKGQVRAAANAFVDHRKDVALGAVLNNK
ncbi:hypothetical protein BLL52_1331 [Rhodoferax antarcticus ANT.BR]|uniref:Uncharacterized protein n=1 Tax=Rhodoferax antarcticus ANT.BR TaxID=1111071 RepID=A0A1Q8YHG5_9BURK|nr:hypothetical protein BLL52_1331 [Rhodoferax antarcticus ANT.BR]